MSNLRILPMIQHLMKNMLINICFKLENQTWEDSVFYLDFYIVIHRSVDYFTSDRLGGESNKVKMRVLREI